MKRGSKNTMCTNLRQVHLRVGVEMERWMFRNLKIANVKIYEVQFFDFLFTNFFPLFFFFEHSNFRFFKF